jgi:parallel beta-helix repeat protein
MKRSNFLFIVFWALCSAYLITACTDNDVRNQPTETVKSFVSSPQVNVQPSETSPENTISAKGAGIYVDDFGADPYDNQPDSDAIQAALDALRSGETLLFTSGIDNEGYVGYLIDKTLFIMMGDPKSDIILRSTDANNPALLAATGDLKGFVMQLFSRARSGSPGEMDNISVQDLHIDGGREIRKCVGADQIGNGIDDNWGSWVEGECPVEDDPWCNAGGISIPGATKFRDYEQDYKSEPSRWSTGLKIDNLTISNVECGTALGFSGAASSITNNTIDTAGEHTHVEGCSTTDPDEELAFWSDGITFDGTEILVENNMVINASDVGIVFFGGKDTRIINNTVISEEGNYGAFAGIAIHTWGFGDISGMEIVGNTVINKSDPECGGIHAGINIGTHMWGGGCRDGGFGNVGNPNSCSGEPEPPQGTLCIVDQLCQIWAHIAPGGFLTLADNFVSGAQINFLIEGLDNLGTLEISGNESVDPQETDWVSATWGCNNQTWGPLDFVAYHPTLPEWTEQKVHCER